MAAITIDFSKRNGVLKPVNGIDNGPVCFGSLIDSTDYYRNAGFPYCRLHDTNYPHPREVDIPTIFRDFEADPDDPASYCFEATDIYLQEIIATGAKIIYRLGSSIEHPKLKYFVDPPKDFDKWAKICLNIARHYNQGWANGFHMGIEYWEVWNEPDQLTDERAKDVMWSGTPQQYFALYAATARLFKREMPEVKIGGFAGCGMLSKKQHDFFIDFLRYAKAQDLPLDFYSWHTYTSSINDIRENARIARDNLDKFGFTKTQSILDEWNYITNMSSAWGDMFGRNGAQTRSLVFSQSSGINGACFTAAALITMLDLPIDIATFYDGHPTNLFCTIFDRYGVPTKQYYAFDAFNRAKLCGERAALFTDIPGIYALATASDNAAGILIANWEGQTGAIPLQVSGLNPDSQYRYELFQLDQTSDLQKQLDTTAKPAQLPANVFLQANSVVFIRFSLPHVI